MIKFSSILCSLTDQELLNLDDDDAYMYRCMVAGEENDSFEFTSKFPLENLSDDECWKFFRFSKDGIYQLLSHLKIPPRYIWCHSFKHTDHLLVLFFSMWEFLDEYISICMYTNMYLHCRYTCSNGTATTGADALLILLRWLSYPCRLCELSSEFHRSTSELSHIINEILDDLHCRFNHKLSDLHFATWMDLDEYCSTIKSKDWYLLGIYRQDMHVYMQTNGRATGHVLWSQVPTLPEIPECDGIIRADSKSFWPNWRISTWYFRGEWTPGAARWGEI